MLKAALKSLLSRKIRLILSGLAVVLGVMAVSGALVLGQTLTKSFDSLFADVYSHVDVQVTSKSNVTSANEGGYTQPLPASTVDQVRQQVPSASKVVGEVGVDGARVIGKNGKVLTTNGPPRLGVDWPSTSASDIVQLRQGHGPQSDNEIALNASLAKSGDFRVGDEVKVLTRAPEQTFKLVGIFGFSGDRDTTGGETYVAFTEPVAQQLMLGQTDAFSDIHLQAKKGVSQAALKHETQKALGNGFEVQTGKELADQSAQQLNQFIGIFKNVLLGFAAVALFVGIFLILNTFSIIVAQRTRELALFRAMGASGRQVINSVLIEAVIIGFIASTLGFLTGLGIAALLKKLFESQSDATLPGSGLVIPASAVIASYVVGIVVTLIAALLPALRASRIPPIAAMREAANTQKPLTKMTVGGLVITMFGAAGVFLALSGKVDDNIWAFLLTGVVLVFIGVAMLTPIISQPTISIIGRVFSWSLAGKLGRRNSARNPRRTAITAATLMVGLALVTGVSVLAASINASVSKLVKTDTNAQLIIQGDNGGFGGIAPAFDPDVITKTRQIPGVDSAVGLYTDRAKYNGKTTSLNAAEISPMKKIFELKSDSGQFRDPKSGEVLIDSGTAKNNHLSVGDTMRITTNKGGEQAFAVIGVFKKSKLMSGTFISIADAQRDFSNPKPMAGFVALGKGADVGSVQHRIDHLLAKNPEVSVLNQKEFLDQQTKQIDSVVTMLYILLGLALVIAILGIVNTLVLSILERTRELGLLRAVGLGRRQTMTMVTIESIVISVFGALLGMVVGCALGAAIVQALKDQGFEVLSLPWGRMVAFLILAVVVGLVAAVIPAIRAARVNVLRAIAYE